MKSKDVVTLLRKIVPIFVILIILTMVVYVAFFQDNKRTAPAKTVDPELYQKVLEPQTATTNPYLQKHAGGYTVRVLTVETPGWAEVYVLSENGNAKWMWLEDDGTGGAKKVFENTGTWTAEKNKISISIQGNSGIFKEEFTWWRPPGGKRGYFIDKDTQRFLERTK